VPTDDVPRGSAGRFLPGQAPKSPGRPPGSRNKLAESFLQVLCDDFRENGKEAIEAVRRDDPSTYMRVVAGILPKELEIRRPLADLTDDELANAVDLIRAAIAADPGHVPDGNAEAVGGKPAGKLQALH
jgi:hypothetical protein